jgi:hypothetical protein
MILSAVASIAELPHLTTAKFSGGQFHSSKPRIPAGISIAFIVAKSTQTEIITPVA